ncbi:MAG: hypothetical protein AAFQ95_21390 [Cyanobacteria bacterium J06621_3]
MTLVNARRKTIDRFRSVCGQSSGLMLWLSVVLHGMITLVPLKAVPERPEEPVLESFAPITVTRLPQRSRLGLDDNADSQPVTPQFVPPLPVPQLVAPQPVEPIEPSSVPEPVITEFPIDVGTENTLIVSGDIVTEDTFENGGQNQSSSSSDEIKAAEMVAIWEGFLDSVPSETQESSLEQILDIYNQPGVKALFFDDDGEHKTSVVNHYLLADKTPEQVFEEVVYPKFHDQQGFDVQEYGEFAGGPVYQIMQGEIVHYLNIVPLARDSVLIVGDRAPE